jgi:hypothetical protein
MKCYFNLTLFIILFTGLSHSGIAQKTYEMPDFSLLERKQWINQIESRDIKIYADNRSDIVYDRIHWSVDPAVNYIKGDIMTRFRPIEDIMSLDFDFATPLVMDSILFHGTPTSFSRKNDILTVQFPFPLLKGLIDSITFFYQGAPVSTGFGSFNLTTHNNTPVLWTLTEPFNARDVWPCKQSLDDKIDSIDIFITNPDKYRSASNGLLVSEETINGQRTAHWKHRYPIATYLVCLGVTNYSTFTAVAPFGNVTTLWLNYIYPENLAAAQAGIADNIKHMQLYDQLFGIYPFQNEKYGVAQFSWGGGQEHQTMTYATSFGFELLAHELAHHWFGDKITCGSWHDIWLNEGFATYLSGICYEHLQPQFWQQFKQTRINNITSQPGGSVYVSDTTNINRIFDNRLTYNKGAMVIHMLRWICGNEAFFRGMQNYLNDPTIAYGYAHTNHLQAHLESASGKKLDGFLADWFTGEGYPSYAMNWLQDADNQVFINVKQKQSHPSVSFFELPVPVRLKGNAGQVKDIVLNNTFDGQNFTDQVGFKITSLEIDPDLWLISKNNVVSNVLVDNHDMDRIEQTFRVMPNPVVNGQMHVAFESVFNSKIKLNLISEDGVRLISRSGQMYKGINTFDIHVATLPAANYLLQVISDHGIAVKKIVIE